MQEFELVSVDWDSVRLMQAGQFKQETLYHEELLRWALQRGRQVGVLHLSDNGVSKPSPEGERYYSVTVRGCYAVGRGGYLIEVPDDATSILRGTIEAKTDLVPLFVGVACTARDADPDLHPSVDVGLLACGGRRRRYKLAADDQDAQYDWVQVAQFQKTPQGLQFDPAYIPDCVFLSAHAALWNGQQEITTLAHALLGALVSNSSPALPRFLAAATLAGSLAGAAQPSNGREHPRVYIARLGGVIAAQRAQLAALPAPNLRAYNDTVALLESTVEYLQGREWTIGYALAQLKRCFEMLLGLYPQLLASLEASAPPPPQRVMQTETAIPAAAPQPIPQQPVAEAPKRRFMWRE